MRCTSSIDIIFYSALIVALKSSFSEAFHQTLSRSVNLIEMAATSMEDDRPYFASTNIISPAGADVGMAAAQTEAAANGWDVTICVCDAGGVPLQVKRNAFPASYDIAVGKAKSAALFAKETGQLEDTVNVVEGKSRTSLLSSPFVLMRGGVPLMLDGVCCGAVGVSGVQAAQDEQVSRVAVQAMSDLFVSRSNQ